MNTRFQGICTLESTTVGRPKNSDSHLLVEKTEYGSVSGQRKPWHPVGLREDGGAAGFLRRTAGFSEWGGVTDGWAVPNTESDFPVRCCSVSLESDVHSLIHSAPLKEEQRGGEPRRAVLSTEPWASWSGCKLRRRPLSLGCDILMPQPQMLNNIIVEFV